MNNVVSLQDEREIKTLIDRLGQVISVNENVAERTFNLLDGESMDTENTRTVSVRFPVELLEALDAHTRERAYRTETRITRNMVVIEAVRDALKASQQGKGKAE